jgi:hypothetical protein
MIMGINTECVYLVPAAHINVEFKLKKGTKKESEAFYTFSCRKTNSPIDGFKFNCHYCTHAQLKTEKDNKNDVH